MVWYGKYDIDDGYAGPSRPYVPTAAERKAARELVRWLARKCYQHPDGNHDLIVAHSGCFRCRKCGFQKESTYQMVGFVAVSNGSNVTNMGNGLPASRMPANANTRLR